MDWQEYTAVEAVTIGVGEVDEDTVERIGVDGWLSAAAVAPKIASFSAIVVPAHVGKDEETR